MDRVDLALYAQESAIGAMLREEACVPVVFQTLRPEDFTDPTCRSVCAAIQKVFLAGKPLDPVTIVGALSGGEGYVPWMKRVMEETPAVANVGEYIAQVREASMLYRFRELCGRGLECFDPQEAAELARKMSLALSGTSRMPRMTGQERFTALYEKLKSGGKPQYLPWGIPTADRATYAELGDMILLGGYSSSGKTLLSLLMAMAQAKAGYKVGYYSLETDPYKLTARQAASMAQIPLERLKKQALQDSDWPRFAQACAAGAGECDFTIAQAAGFTVDDITTDALGHGYQIIYVDYVQQLRVSGMRADNPRIVVTEISQRLKRFAQSTHTAVVALAQLSRPEAVLVGSGQNKRKVIVPPSMHSFKESGQLEQDADVAFLIWPKDSNNNDSARMFKIGKNKEGARYTVELAFHGDTQTMTELEQLHSVAAELSAKGRAVKQRNRAQAHQIGFQELTSGEADNPFA